jgi:hypothetical protein
MTAHARYSPSGSKRWMACPGSLVLEAPFPDVGSIYSDPGTAMHTVASRCLLQSSEATHHYATGHVGQQINVAGDHEEDRFVTFSQEHAEVVNDYLTALRGKAEGAAVFLVEHRVDFSEFVGVPNQFGTADACMLHPLEDGTFELDVTDLKTGFKVISPVNNSQLMIYALGLYRELELAYPITQVRLSIFQPEQGGMVEWRCSITDLMAFADSLAFAVARCESAAATAEMIHVEEEQAEWERTHLNPNPNEDQCAFCRAMATCPAMRRKIEETVGSAFEVISETGVDTGKLQVTDESYLSKAMKAAGVLEDWIKAVRAEVERRLVSGIPVEGYGLELGREGARRWVHTEEVVEYLKKSVRLRNSLIYKMELLSPTQMEKLAGYDRGKKRKLKDGEKVWLNEYQWQELTTYIERSEAKPSVKPLDKITEQWLPKPLDDAAFTAAADDGSDLY